MTIAIAPLAVSTAHAQQLDQAAWQALNAQVQTRSDALNRLIAKADAQGVNTDYAKVSVETIKAFQQASDWDYNNVEEVRSIFKTYNHYKKTDPTAADRLPGDELNATLEVADYAIDQLQKQLAGEITLSETPDFSKGEIKLAESYYKMNGEVVFPYTLFWLPKVGSTMPDAFGRVGETYFAPSMLQPDGTVNRFSLKKAVNSAKEQAKQNFAPLYHFWGHRPGGWQREQHPNAMIGARRFTQYDIDSPLVRTWVEQLTQGFLPDVAEAYGDGEILYLLANEPHFATAERGWLVKNGLSDFTEAKYQQWLEKKYGSVAELNRSHGSKHKSFDTIEMPFPIKKAKRGQAEWYDWCRFNMDRVNEWFTFLKQSTRDAVTDRKIPVTIKMLGHHLIDAQRDQGMDIEYLVNLQDVTGGDLRVEPFDAEFYTHMEGGVDPKTSWKARYAYQWVSQGIFLDFVRSIAPEKVFYDSEWHGFGAVHWRHYNLDRNYVRAAIWHAYSNGMGMILPWMWGRNDDGSLKKSADQIGELATQPIAVDSYGRTMKELNAFADIFAKAALPEKRTFMLFYNEASAIQNREYANHLGTTYEALKLLNFTVGITTPTHIKTLNPKEQIVILPPTSYISDASLSSLKDFQIAGGKIVFVGEGHSLKKTELGAERKGNSGLKPFATIQFQQPYELASEFERLLTPFAMKQPTPVRVADTQGNKAYGVFVQQVRDQETGDVYVILNNASRDRRTITIHSDSKLVDAITGQAAEHTFVMPMYDARLIKVLQ